MYLVDTSVWVDYIKGTETAAVDFLDKLVSIPMAAGITDLIYMELLQGARSESAFDRLQQYFSTQLFHRFEDYQAAHESAARLFFTCRRQGITIRSSNDCLIAQCALENDVVLLHQDSDFVHMGKAVPELQQKHFFD